MLGSAREAALAFLPAALLALKLLKRQKQAVLSCTTAMAPRVFFAVMTG